MDNNKLNIHGLTDEAITDVSSNIRLAVSKK